MKDIGACTKKKTYGHNLKLHDTPYPDHAYDQQIDTNKATGDFVTSSQHLRQFHETH